jgi:hypothetical protein
LMMTHILNHIHCQQKSGFVKIIFLSRHSVQCAKERILNEFDEKNEALSY